MLDQDTKKRIDSARNILVGKVPDPKAQIDQITTALIYKFMDDMDKENIELGGKARFFISGLKDYGWTRLMDKSLSGTERLDLYVRAISEFAKSDKIPRLFRDIFKDSFLPYRDPETLNLFLKEINGFTYDHSENLGNAFEYLLSILGSQGDAGQFRTPRHIIDFIVDVVAPQKSETILDPACGTSGFLISAYKHILKMNSSNYNEKTDVPTFASQDSPTVHTVEIQSDGKYGGDKLTPTDKKKIAKNVVGYDISPDMVKLSLVNMYLHGFKNPKISEYDALTYEDKWDEMYDVIFANPPFMTPQGGIRPHNRFQVKANKAEILFTGYIAEHLTLKGRAGIIVPEGIIFNAATAYTNLRKMLIDNDYLYAVVSLPAGVFKPYSGVKTSILFLDKEVAKNNKEILFVKVDNDGYGLGEQRLRIEKNDLPEAFKIISEWKKGKKMKSNITEYVSKENIKNKSSYSFKTSQYGEADDNSNIKWDMAELGEVLDYEQPTNYIVNSTNYNDKYKTPVLTAGKTFILGYSNETDGIFCDNLPVIIFDDFTTATKFVDFPFKVKSSAMKILHTDPTKANIKYLYYIMQVINFKKNEHKRYWISEFSKIKIPLPPIEFQDEIVSELERYQKIIDGGNEIINNWKPTIQIDPKWELVELDKVVKINRGGSPRPIKNFITNDKDGVNWIKIGDTKTVNKYIYKTKEKIKPEGVRHSREVKEGDFILSNSMSFGRPYIMKTSGCIHDGWLLLREKNKTINKDFLYYILCSDYIYNKFKKAASGGVVNNLNIDLVKQVSIPLPPLKLQEKIVEEKNSEKLVIDSVAVLIETNKQKIKDKITDIWGEKI